MNTHKKIKTAIIDGFARVESRRDSVKSICVNADILKQIRVHLIDLFDPYTRNENITELGELKGSLFGANVLFDSQIKDILFTGEHGTEIIVSISKKQDIEKEQKDDRNKFIFIFLNNYDI